MALNDWMSEIDDTKKMNEICLPGAHDAGMVKALTKFEFGGLATQANAATQGLTLRGQLDTGIRWLDIRIDKTNKCFHSTAHGETADDTCKAIMEFLDDNATETVIVLLTKSYSKTDFCAYKYFLNKLNSYCLPLHGPKSRPPLAPGETQIAKLQLGALRGRVVVAMDKPPVPTASVDKRVVRTLLAKYDAKETWNDNMLKTFNSVEAGTGGQNKYGYVLNSAGSYSDKNSVDTIQSGQVARAQRIKSANKEEFMGVYYTTCTAPIGLRTTSIEAQDKLNWANAQVLKWTNVAFQAKQNTVTKPLFNCVMMDFADATRVNYIRGQAAAKSW